MFPHIDIEVEPQYLAAYSREGHYTFAYHITLHNRGEQAAQLLSRHWIITDGNEQVEEVRGQGVVGEQPRIAPGASYRYSSGVTLATTVGSMYGSYQMCCDDGSTFEIPIPPFTLAVPGSLN